jgi:hypothetical protein
MKFFRFTPNPKTCPYEYSLSSFLCLACSRLASRVGSYLMITDSAISLAQWWSALRDGSRLLKRSLSARTCFARVGLSETWRIRLKGGIMIITQSSTSVRNNSDRGFHLTEAHASLETPDCDLSLWTHRDQRQWGCPQQQWNHEPRFCTCCKRGIPPKPWARSVKRHLRSRD